MNRRKALTIAAGVVAGGGAGLLTLTNAFKPETIFDNEPHKLPYKKGNDDWKYSPLDPVVSAELAYKYYTEGSCMYATVKSIISQLADKLGEPYKSFPIHLFKYGHGGVGGYGSICGALNGAAALIGLLITDKSVQDKMIADVFQWYEKEPLPQFKPQSSSFDYIPVRSISQSILCHAANTNWCKTSGFKVNSNERKERCRRMTSDVVIKVTGSLNEIFTGTYTTNVNPNETVNSCMTCHGSTGKVNNTAAKMSCNPCHTESAGHRVFADIHYRLMKE
ncbi:MAG TPA: C-GCAxxG-C-C family protein [Bacteroidales bacterium]|nr:C-GCAxxG-C-C family protein [Bacteroidales bacterium]HPJ60670.1 C-GCAxxG-C-C family protein [Bacteroidales bacterium]HPR13523.1 C-GCAxxG-C-C family protein [Bacteroidales bacterium]HRW85211.1 C-GCAxxG-C-C family protein [Bacteroidales bacterium]